MRKVLKAEDVEQADEPLAAVASTAAAALANAAAAGRPWQVNDRHSLVESPDQPFKEERIDALCEGVTHILALLLAQVDPVHGATPRVHQALHEACHERP